MKIIFKRGNNMQSLKELMDMELKNLSKDSRFKQLENFITEDKKSAEFITSLTGNFKFETPEEDNPLYSVAQVRARHSAISFLMGLVFKNFYQLDKKIDKMLELKEHEEIFQKLWLMTSLNHDRGYTSRLISNDNLDYKETFKWYLLTDSYKEARLECIKDFANKHRPVFAYTYDEILAYDHYAKCFHAGRCNGNESTEIERVDHGILGGLIVFNELTKKYLNEIKEKPLEMLIIKSSSAAIVQHNFFKSMDAEQDKKYPLELEKLKSTSEFRIGTETPLLFLLSLVDTIECAKRLSKKENQNDYIQTLTVLKSIKVEVFQKLIIIDFSDLRKAINNKPTLENNLNKHLNSIKALGSWTKSIVEEKSPDIMKISVA